MKLYRIFRKNIWLKIALLVVIIQQLLVAGGTYFLGELSRQYPTQGFQINVAIALFICIFLPGTIVHYWLAWCTTKTYKQSQLDYLNEYTDTNYNNPTQWRNDEFKRERHDVMSRGGQETIESALHFFIDSTATGLNIIFNTISIVFVTDLALGIIIAVAGLLGLLIVHLAENRISKSSRKEMSAETALNSHLSRSWDNIILGNQLFFNRWKEHFNDLFVKTESASIESTKQRQSVICLAGMVTNGLVLGGALFLAWFYQNISGFVLAILVMLPRSLQIVMHIQIIQSYLAQWKNLKEKLRVTDETLSDVSVLDLSPLIQSNSISIKMNHESIESKELENTLFKIKSGRVTITGPNGVGKSCLLLKLKSKLNSRAAYLPAQHQLMIQESQLGLSSGEIALAAIRDMQTGDHSFLLLDEWDANLSMKNREILNELINQISKEKTVIEVRHNI